jgi:hypothetical protein
MTAIVASVNGPEPAGADVLVVGTAHHGGLKRMVHGSVGAYCSRYSRCPAAVIEAGRPRWYPGHAGAASADKPRGPGRRAHG